MYFLNRRDVPIIAIMIGCSHASRPYIDSASPFTSFLEEFNGTVWRFHVTDPDKGDNLTIRPLDNITAQYFSIDQLGDGNDVWVDVTLNKPLDRETLGPEVTASFSITDTQHNEIDMVHTLDIFDVNDNRPKFEYSVYTLGINELPCNKTTVCTKIHATDKDSGENARIGYSMVSSELWKMYNDTFSIDPVNGSVTLNKCLDYERNDFYNYTVMAKDMFSCGSNMEYIFTNHDKIPFLQAGTDFGPNGGLNSTAVLTIHVKDVKDESSVITG